MRPCAFSRSRYSVGATSRPGPGGLDHRQEELMQGLSGARDACLALPSLLRPRSSPPLQRARTWSGARRLDGLQPSPARPQRDGLENQVDLPFSIDFWGNTYDQRSSHTTATSRSDDSLSTYTPFALTAPDQAIIAPFFADVDTRGSGSETVKYGWGNTTFEAAGPSRELGRRRLLLGTRRQAELVPAAAGRPLGHPQRRLRHRLH